MFAELGVKRSKNFCVDLCSFLCLFLFVFFGCALFCCWLSVCLYRLARPFPPTLGGEGCDARALGMAPRVFFSSFGAERHLRRFYSFLYVFTWMYDFFVWFSLAVGPRVKQFGKVN